MVGSLDDLQKLVRESENAHIELKREVSKDVIKGLSTDIAALANFEGGHIVFGFSNSKEPVGCVYEDKDLDQISQQAGNCRPSVTINFEKISFGTQQFLIITVPKTTVLHSDTKNRFPIRIGNTTGYLDITSILMLAQERGLLGGGTSEITNTTRNSERRSLSEDEVLMIVEGLGSKDSTLRSEALLDLNRMSLGYALFEHQEVVDLLHNILNKGTNEEIDQTLNIVRTTILSGSSSEKKVVSHWMDKIRKIGESSSLRTAARRAFDVLQLAGHPGAVDLLEKWITNADDERYSELHPENQLSNVRFYGLDNKIRSRMCALLKKKPGEIVTNRVQGVLESVRRAY